MNAKMFSIKRDDKDPNITRREYCVDGKVHFTRLDGGWIEDKCVDFRPCKGECVQHSFVLPENVAEIVSMALRDNFAHRYQRQLSVKRSGNVVYSGPNIEYKFPDNLDGWQESEHWERVK